MYDFSFIYLGFALISTLHLDGKFWDFTSDLAKGDTAYTTLALGAHTDTTYFASIASVIPGSHLVDQSYRRIPAGCNSSIFSNTRAAQGARRYLSTAFT